MYYPEEVIEEVRTKNDIVDIISGYVGLQKKGTSHFGLCPFHNEKSPSFSVSQNKQMYYCFGCGAGGNVFTFLMEYENFLFVEAVKVLADRAGVSLPEMNHSKEAKEKSDLRMLLLEINKVSAQYFYTQLRLEQGEIAHTYLKNRGLSEDMVKAFGLGYSNKYSNDLYKYLVDKGYKEVQLRQAGLITTDEKNGVYDKFWNRVMFPIMDVNSKVIGFGGRVMGDGKPKYLNSPETLIFDKSRNLYGLNRARTSRESCFLVCEGYMDVISLHQAGFTNAVASLGTALTAGHAALIRRYVREVYLTYDSDEAGIRATLRALPILRDAGISAKVIRMDPYKDPDEFIKVLGAEAFEKCIKNATNGFLFGLEILAREHNMEEPEDKTIFFKEVARRLMEFEDELERNNYMEVVAKAYGVSQESLRKLVTKVAIGIGQAKPVVRPKPAPGQEKPKENTILQGQSAILTAMIEDEALFGMIKEYISPDDFTDDLYKTVAVLLYEQYDRGELNPAKILNNFTQESDHRKATSIFHAKTKGLSTKAEREQALKEAISKVKVHSIENRWKQTALTDMPTLQGLIKDKGWFENIENLHISIK